jgi:hypothetical protein
MAQLSRPYQVALAAIGVLAAVWFIALRGHSGSGGGSSVPAPQAAAPAPKAATPAPSSPSAPGVAGLTRAVEKARGAVRESERDAKQLQQKSAEASSPSSTGAPSASSTGGTRPSPSPTRPSSAATRTSPSGPNAHSGHPAPALPGAPARQARVEGELKQGHTVLVLLWNPKGAEDRAVRFQLQALREVERIFGVPQNQRYVLEEAAAKEVGSFGTFTRAVQVYQTPTILIILPNGKTTTMTGLTDAYAIQQAISDARKG